MRLSVDCLKLKAAVTREKLCAFAETTAYPSCLSSIAIKQASNVTLEIQLDRIPKVMALGFSPQFTKDPVRHCYFQADP